MRGSVDCMRRVAFVVGTLDRPLSEAMRLRMPIQEAKAEKTRLREHCLDFQDVDDTALVRQHIAGTGFSK